MELHELKKGDRFQLDFVNPAPDKEYEFDHLDSMYSFCRVVGSNEIVHLKHWTPVIKTASTH